MTSSSPTPSEGQLVEALRPAVSKIFDHFDELSRGQALQILVDAMRDLEPSSEIAPPCELDGCAILHGDLKTQREIYDKVAARSAIEATGEKKMKVTDEMVDRFLSWKLPEDFHPDAGISFTPYFNVEYNAKQGLPPARHNPIGTNLLTATQARAMLEHVLGASTDAK